MSNAQIKCPTCKRRGGWFATPYGPFCSKRCKLIDLGKWLGEEHAISEPLTPEEFQKLANQPPDPPRGRSESNKNPQEQ